ncbi:MAG: Hsp20/alpha crystallin family protein [Saprospiraceae bacterium]|nr:Hsp20/alpha crystallin family protein [Saprospiraceae bacterium]
MMYTNFYACSPKSCKTTAKSGINSPVNREYFHVPLMNQRVLENELVIEISLPGVLKENVKLHIEENMVTVTAERKMSREGMTFKHREFADRKFKSEFKIGDALDMQTIDAKFDQGVLYIKIAKKPISKISIEVK